MGIFLTQILGVGIWGEFCHQFQWLWIRPIQTRSLNFPRARVKPLGSGTVYTTKHCNASLCILGTTSVDFNLALMFILNMFVIAGNSFSYGLLMVNKALNSWRVKYNEIVLFHGHILIYIDSKTITAFHARKPEGRTRNITF